MKSVKNWQTPIMSGWLPSDFKKKNGYKRSTELSHEYGMYRQDYCGCVFSYRERHPEAVATSDDAPLNA